MTSVSVAYGPLLSEFAKWQWARPHYQFFPFVILAFVGILATRYRSATPRANAGSSPRTSRVTLFFVVTSWFTLLVAIVLYSPVLAALSAVLLCGAVCSLVARFRHVPYLWGIWMLTWLVIPIPLGRDRQLISILQLASSWLSSAALDALGILHLMEGNTLLLPDKQLFVDEACSGIVSILSIAATAAIYGVWRNRTPLQVVALSVMGVGWATLLNVVRITTIAYVYDRYGYDLSTGTPHEVLGIALFAMTFTALAATEQFIIATCSPIETAWVETTGRHLHFGKWLVKAWDSLVTIGAPTQNASKLTPLYLHSESHSPQRTRLDFSGITAVVIMVTCLAILQLSTMPDGENQASRVTKTQAVERAIALKGNALPETLAGFKLREHQFETRESKHFFGEYSSIFHYIDSEGSPLVISFDFVFPGGWHDLAVCYKSIGWKSDDSAVLGVEDDVNPWKFVEYHYRKLSGEFAVVIFSEFSEAGERLDPPGGTILADLMQALSRRQRPQDFGNCFQVQVLLTGDTALTSEQLIAGRTALVEARECFLTHITQPNQTAATRTELAKQ
jgi:exosortase